MELIKKILAPTDLSSMSGNGVHFAVRLAKATGAEVVIAHVVNTEEFISYARTLEMTPGKAEEDTLLQRLVERHRGQLDAFLSRPPIEIGPEIKVRKLVELGAPARRILQWAGREKVDTIVMSTHGRSGLSKLLLGSVTEKVIRSAEIPVMVVPSVAGQEA